MGQTDSLVYGTIPMGPGRVRRIDPDIQRAVVQAAGSREAGRTPQQVARYMNRFRIKPWGNQVTMLGRLDRALEAR
eukprot:10871298-Lingulodinium_polyedra.AAC.1